MSFTCLFLLCNMITRKMKITHKGGLHYISIRQCWPVCPVTIEVPTPLSGDAFGSIRARYCVLQMFCLTNIAFKFLKLFLDALRRVKCLLDCHSPLVSTWSIYTFILSNWLQYAFTFCDHCSHTHTSVWHIKRYQYRRATKKST